MQMEKPGPERFVTVRQFRPLDEEKLNSEHFARVCVYEAGQPGSNLKKFLKEKILFGNFGDIGTDEIRDLAKDIFVGERSAAYLTQMRSDSCIGYSNEEVDSIIILLLETPNVDAALVAQALGYLPPRPRY